jgi:hypothetical protein
VGAAPARNEDRSTFRPCISYRTRGPRRRARGTSSLRNLGTCTTSHQPRRQRRANRLTGPPSPQSTA